MDKIKNLIITENYANVEPCINKLYFEDKAKFINDSRLDILKNRIEQLNDWYNMNLDYNFEITFNDNLLVRIFQSNLNFNTGLHSILETLYIVDGMFCMKSYENFKKNKLKRGI
jgi:hypothetical protein